MSLHKLLTAHSHPVCVFTIHHKWDINTDQDPLTWKHLVCSFSLWMCQKVINFGSSKKIFSVLDRVPTVSWGYWSVTMNVSWISLPSLQGTTRGLGNFLLKSRIKRWGQLARNKGELQVHKIYCIYIAVPFTLRSPKCWKISIGAHFLREDVSLSNTSTAIICVWHHAASAKPRWSCGRCWRSYGHL